MKSKAFITAAFLASSLLSNAVGAQEIDVVHYWTSGSESKAIKVLADAYKADGGIWNDVAAPGFDDALALSISRITGGDGPSVFLAGPGDEINEMYRSGMLRDFNDLAAAGNWKDNVPTLVWEYMQVDGNVVALPMGMHANNWIYYSKPVFDKLGLREPENWNEMFTALDRIKEAGHVPLALGGEAWQEVYLFTNAILETGGGELYRALFVDHDGEAATRPEVVEAFNLVRRLNDYVDEGSPGRSWNETTNMIITDRAGLHMMGDWALGEFGVAGQVGGKDYGCFLAPAVGDPYLVVIDIMAFPKPDNDSEAKGQDLLARKIMDPDVMAGVSAAKGSVPALTAVAQDKLSHCAAIGARASLVSENVMPTTYMSLDADSRGKMSDLVGQYWSDKSMSAEDAAAQLKTILRAAM